MSDCITCGHSLETHAGGGPCVHVFGCASRCRKFKSNLPTEAEGRESSVDRKLRIMREALEEIAKMNEQALEGAGEVAAEALREAGS